MDILNQLMRLGAVERETKGGLKDTELSVRKLQFFQYYKKPTRCNNNNFIIINFNQLNMFRAIISPILKSTRLCLELVV